ncbi:hypothetical protein SCLCIDRAFT_1217994 [Scleroderma citrinum Foug A]|uniref:Uncharacterized protein n=1 Tax=Scleroderma citrinum Foug A TaxID=1036808 RepID=A0A0C3A3F3_9AGAM|nr:hypothetical protein SCLCIDRAFT_1217994 [Scleroderma citrinum Foug A]
MFGIGALLLSIALFIIPCFAQTYITLPSAGTNVTAGSNITVQVSVATGPINLDVISVAIGLQSCISGCTSTSTYLGTILYAGSFKSQGLGTGNTLYENFTVTIPASMDSGQAILGVANFYLDGAGNGPNLNVVNETVYIN